MVVTGHLSVECGVMQSAVIFC